MKTTRKAWFFYFYIMSKRPLGFFDSGIGGTSIWKEVCQLLPNEDTVYLCDSNNSPYGIKSKDEIIQICEKNTETLLNYNAKLVVVACNTATTNAIQHLRMTYNIPFIGIEPAIKPASLATKNNTIGVLATKGTLDSELFEKTSNTLSSDIKIISREGTGIVQLIEKGCMNSVEMTQLLKQHLHPLLALNMDALVLGCTHYPYLTEQIRNIVGNSIQIIDSGKAVAKQTKAILEKHRLLEQKPMMGNHRLITNGLIKVIKEVVKETENISIEQRAF